MKRILVIVFVALAVLTSACGQGNVFNLEVGTCFDDLDSDGGEISNVPIVDCADPHDNEVYHLFDMPGGDFPGSSAVEEQAIDGCLAAFEPYVGKGYDTSTLGLMWLNPTPHSWNEGDREIVCLLYDFNLVKLTGSMQGSGI